MIAWLTFWRPFLFGVIVGVVLSYVAYTVLEIVIEKSGQK